MKMKNKKRFNPTARLMSRTRREARDDVGVRGLRSESGEMTIVIALIITTLLVIAAFVTDIGLAYVNIGKAQDAADASALSVKSMLPVDANNGEAVNALYTSVIGYAAKNGYTVSRDDIKLERNGDKYTSVTVSVNATTKTYFASLIGIDSLKAARSAKVGQVEKRSAVFDYCIFSADENYQLRLGAVHNIYGSVRSNGSISIDAGKGYVSGAAAACGTVYVNIWTSYVGDKVEGVEYLDMPDYSDVIGNLMPAYYNTQYTASQISAISSRQNWNGNIKITGGNVKIRNGLDINGNVYVDGDLTVNGGGPFNVIGNLYVNGNLTFTNSVNIRGAVFATGNVVFNGSTTQIVTTEPVCVYSQHGNITIVPGSTQMTGIVYAPEGTIKIAGNNLSFTGSLIGNRVEGMPANLTMYTGTDSKYIPSESYTGLID